MATPPHRPFPEEPPRRHRHDSPHAGVIEQAVLEILYRIHLGGGGAPAPRAPKPPAAPKAAGRPAADRDAWARFQAGLAAGG